MKVLFTTQPGMGHAHPLLPLARGLRQAGHEVVFACAASFAPHIEAAGFPVFAAGLDWLVAEAERTFPEMRDMSLEERTAFLTTDVFIDVAGNAMARDLLELCTTWRPDVIVRDGCEYGGCIVGEALHIPHAMVSIDFYTPNYLARLVIEKPLAYLRSAFGLPPYPALDMLTRYLYFTYIPPGYHFHPLPPVTHPLRPLFLEHSWEAELPEWVTHLPDRPTVYVSLGTVLRVSQVYATIIEGLKHEPITLIVSLGRTQAPADFGSQPPNVRIEPYIANDTALLRYCDLVVTHGGANTTLAALSCGLSVVVIPFAGHMLQQGVRCKALGAGTILRPSQFAPPARSVLHPSLLLDDVSPLLTIETIRQTVREMLAQSAYRQAAQRLQAEMNALPGVEYAVTLLERLSRTSCTAHP